MLWLFNYSLRIGQVPAKWRHGIIVPLLKPNKPANSMASFRPVTLTSAPCKLMERIVARRVRDCIEDKLQPQQAGIRPARSTLDTLMQVTSAVRRRKDGEKAAAVFIDSARVPSIPRITAALSRSFSPFAWRSIWLRGSRAFCRDAQRRRG
ncbi:putative Reverse transcriptase (RNA dependent DNA polymerase) [Trypanosoma vivax]|nr:putative Reverse transcriptase (RNA dependent DNA polymerase) [Trypanosoma vivax]